MKIILRILVLFLLLTGCNMAPKKVSMDDPRIQPLIKAASSFDRKIYGFTTIPNSADVRWESKPTKQYDAMLHIYSKTSRTISFRKKATGFSWTGEQETFQGPKKYTTPDGTFNESITLTYEIESVSGNPTNQLNISYFGEDARLVHRDNLSLGFIRPILKEWGY